MHQSILGHEQIIMQLHRAIQCNRIGGAYLFCGPSQVGKETVARLFAKTMYCPRLANQACGDCRSCRKIDADNHPDFHIIRPLGTSVKIDQIRQLQKSIIYRPYDGTRKVVIVSEAERMNLEAANCLLKTLEEPPLASVLILLTANLDVLLPTIRSRCQIFQFQPLAVSELACYLTKRYSLDKSQALSIATHARGAVGKALVLLESQLGQECTNGEESVPKIPEILMTKDLLSVFRIAEYFSNNPHELDSLLTWYRDLLFLHQDVPSELITHTSHTETLKELLPRYSMLRLQLGIKTIFETKEALRRNVNAMLALEVMTLKLLRD